MKVALLIAGYLRNYDTNISFIKNKILQQFGNIDVYIHITKHEKEQDKYFNTNDEEKDIKYIEEVLSPICKIIEPNILFCNNAAQNNLLNHWSKLYKLNSILKINELHLGKKYDLVIRYRPDVCLADITFATTTSDIIIPKDSKVDKSKLLRKTDPHLCDAFAYGPSDKMDKYFKIFEHLPKLIEKYGTTPETILYRYLKTHNIRYTLKNIKYGYILSKCNVIAICGDSGSGKTTLSNILKQYFNSSFTLECDRYHKWERNNENWQTVTHLNPKANFITKMNKDIFDLKIGKSIYQVDYDHKTGKFTEKEHIKNANNLIVCGLHSLYNKNNEVYNLKIYIDTDPNLKFKWKILRDTKNRGQSSEKVQELIEKRKGDYYKYIYPQRKLSDLVVNFFEPQNNSSEKICLKIFVNKKYFLGNILNTLSQHGISCITDYTSDKVFNIVTFKEFKNTNLLQDSKLKRDDYYDYIVFFILNLRASSSQIF